MIRYPVHKKSGKKHDPENHPAVGKVAERFIRRQLSDYLDSIHYLSHDQFGFRQGLSTEMALLAMTGATLRRMQRQNFIFITFLYLSKAFNYVSHEIILSKLGSLGVREAWFGSYLSSRRQRACQDWWSSSRSQVRELWRNNAWVNPETVAVHYLSEWHFRLHPGAPFGYETVAGYAHDTQTANQCIKQSLAATVSNAAVLLQRGIGVQSWVCMRMNTAKIQAMPWGTRHGFSLEPIRSPRYRMTGKGWTIMLLLTTWVPSSIRKWLSPPHVDSTEPRWVSPCWREKKKRQLIRNIPVYQA